jgi:hypothetical protein
MKDMVTSKKFIASILAILVYIAGRFGFDLDSDTVDRIFAALLVYVGAQGVADSGKSAALIAKTASIAIVILMMTGCESMRHRASAGVGAFLDCESEHLDAKLLADAKSLAITAVRHWIGGDGHIDTAGIKADAAPIKTDLGRCAFTAAIIAVATPAKSYPDAPAAAPMIANSGELMSTMAGIKANWGVAEIRTSAGPL